jgi:hypothetical protein
LDHLDAFNKVLASILKFGDGLKVDFIILVLDELLKKFGQWVSDFLA